MDEKSLCAHIINLTAPWQVKSLALDENRGRAEPAEQLRHKPNEQQLSDAVGYCG
ncbi:hypothetical protein [Citrobacter meridianamericanus]|uniref:Transposase n=1 Tax=Citrobacter meridianamericanus TaxID=2894201 RepID=A0ABT1BHJ8_9ENTR|nr:hypothetical protein [Citrobacter meridianamericanus]MCO5784534.1 hypothetical protein [Citrobacter meridianamericanus]